MNRILNFGSLNIDYVYKVDHMTFCGETQMSESRHTYSGGKGLNQSIALARAGAEVYHAGCIGTEGEFLIRELADAGVDVSGIRILEDIPTGHTIIQNDRNGDNSIILYGGANQSVTKEQVKDTLSRFESGDWIVLQNEISEVPYIMEKAHEKGMCIVFNPSPVNESIKKYPLDYVDWFLLNEIEASFLSDADSDNASELIQSLSQSHPTAKIVLTIGSKGAVCFDGSVILEQEAFPVKAVDTTAAGDTFTGYFISEIIRGSAVKEALKIAACAASIAVTIPGAAPSIPLAFDCFSKLL